MKKSDLTTNLLGQEIFSGSYHSLLKILAQQFKKRKKTLTIFTPNPEQLVLAKREKTFAKTLGLADILIPDGIGLLLASRVLGTRLIKERLTGIDLATELLKFAKRNHLDVLIIGGRGYEGKQVFDQRVKIPILGQKERSRGVWWLEGYERVLFPTKGETSLLLNTLHDLKPAIVFVAFYLGYTFFVDPQ